MQSVENLIAQTIKIFETIDILVNVAGVGGFGHFTEVSPDEFDRIMRINVSASLYCAQAAAKEMLKNKYGRIINVASIAGERAGEHRTAYGTSKAAVIGLTKQGARDLGRHGITVNAIAPGPVDTPLTREIHTEKTRTNYLKVIPAGRYGTVDEIADAALFLAGEAAGYVNGHTLFVDGGYVSAGVAEAGDRPRRRPVGVCRRLSGLVCQEAQRRHSSEEQGPQALRPVQARDRQGLEEGGRFAS